LGLLLDHCKFGGVMYFFIRYGSLGYAEMEKPLVRVMGKGLREELQINNI
jgi:hypothetical protein